MIDILYILLMLVIGIIVLTKGSDWMTDSMVPVAQKLGTSYIAIASILVSIMLSIPEIFVAVYAYFMGHGGISLGVVIGSIICNIGLMTGLSAMIKPLYVDKRVVIRDGIFALVISFIVFIFGMDGQYNRSDGIVLLLLFIPYILNVWYFEKWASLEEKEEELKEIQSELKVIGLSLFELKPGFLQFVFGSIFLLFGSYVFSHALIKIAAFTGLSDVIIGLTIGAIGPSIPNIVSAVNGTIKNYTKIAITETFGSDIFTLLVTLGLIAIISPIDVDAKWLKFDIPMMLFMTLLMMFFIFKGHEKGKFSIQRHEGGLLVIFYVIFLILSIILNS